MDEGGANERKRGWEDVGGARWSVCEMEGQWCRGEGGVLGEWQRSCGERWKGLFQGRKCREKLGRRKEKGKCVCEGKSVEVGREGIQVWSTA